MVKRIVGWFVLVPLCAVLIVFALANRQLVMVNFNPFTQCRTTWRRRRRRAAVPRHLRRDLLVGVLLGGIATWFAQSHHRRDERTSAARTSGCIASSMRRTAPRPTRRCSTSTSWQTGSDPPWPTH
jgi:hypothetical protein